MNKQNVQTLLREAPSQILVNVPPEEAEIIEILSEESQTMYKETWREVIADFIH